MRIQHTTTASVLPSILRRGICGKYSRGARPVCWFHTPSVQEWAAIHVQRRHGGSLRQVVTLECDVPRAWLRRHAMRGKYFCVRDVPPERIRKVITWGQFSESR